MRFGLLLCAALACFGFGSASAAAQEQFELKDGDRVVFLGNTLIEREQKYGYWELMLTMAWPERNVTFRNLGWSGDTVWGESRAGFGSQADGFKKLVEEVNAAKPTVIFVGYGNVEAFEGEKGLPKFVEGCNKLLDELEKTKARIVVLGPIYQIVSLSPNSAAKDYNRSVVNYSKEIKRICNTRNLSFVDLCGPNVEFLNDSSAQLGLSQGTVNAMSTNGLDLTDGGYAIYGLTIVKKLQVPEPEGGASTPEASAKELRKAVLKKNELFFHRWRPQNETYLFGFRKHEQGKNAAEVFQFDPLVEAEEKKIAELRVKLAAEMKKNGGAK
jgi:glycosyltransferase involved in cell wall biosynthesis